MRLLKPVEFRSTFADGKRWRCQAFTITARSNELEHPRMGLAISRKAAPRAVDRNRIKRVIRESFRNNVSTIGALDIVVQATPKARTQSNTSLSGKLAVLWRELK